MSRLCTSKHLAKRFGRFGSKLSRTSDAPPRAAEPWRRDPRVALGVFAVGDVSFFFFFKASFCFFFGILFVFFGGSFRFFGIVLIGGLLHCSGFSSNINLLLSFSSEGCCRNRRVRPFLRVCERSSACF